MCKNYFFLKHRNEERGIGGIFFDYLENDWKQDFQFVKGTGLFFLNYLKDMIELLVQNLGQSFKEKLLC